MAGPWEKYSKPAVPAAEASQEPSPPTGAGPWAKYQAQAARAPSESEDGGGLAQSLLDLYRMHPRAYLQRKMLEEGAKGDPLEQAGSLAESAGNTVAMGYMPQLAGAAKSLVGDQSYVDARDEYAKNAKARSEKYPIASTVGSIAGMAGTLPLTRAKALVDAPTRAGRIMKQIGVGGGMAALSNPGEVEGEVGNPQLKERGARGAVGAALGLGIGSLSELARYLGGGPGGGGGVADKLSQVAEEKAFKALGARKTFTDKLGPDQQREIGRQLLDEHAIPVLGSPTRISKRVDGLKEEAGDAIGKIIDDVDSRTVEYTPVRFRDPKKPTVVQEEVRMTPVRFEENRLKESMPWLRDADAPPQIIRGEEQAIQTKLLEPPKPGYTTTGEVKTMPGKGLTVDMKSLTNQVMKSNVFRELEAQYGTETAKAALERYLTNLASKGSLGLRDAQKTRQLVDKGINFSKRAGEHTPAQEVLYELRTQIRDGMNTAANQVPGQAKDALLNANRRYSNLEQAADILEDRISRDAANRSVSLTDTISGVGGAGIGTTPAEKIVTGAVATAANKAGRTFGTAAMARGADETAKLLRSFPKLAKYAEQNPVAAQQLIDKILKGNSTPVQEAPEEYRTVPAEIRDHLKGRTVSQEEAAARFVRGN